MTNQGQPTVRLNDRGDAVRRVQRAIRRSGANTELVVDGQFGPPLETAVMAFQELVNLTADGIVGPRTWKELPDGGPMPTLKVGSHGPVVRRLQEVISNGDWSQGPVAADGEFGQETRAAVEAFQAYVGVAVDGVVGERTWDAFFAEAPRTLETEVGLEFVQG
jgi:peptidoglycan hydrolase-like protein with peptidoglycan-binding domain